MRDAFVARLAQRARQNARLHLITADLGFGVLTQFAADLPAQYLNVGVAEQNMTGIATGLALEGRTVFTYSIANFPTLRCLEQIRNDACYHDANVKIVSIGGGFSYGALGMSHHATEDLSIMRALPGVTVIVPSTTEEAQVAVDYALETPGVCYLRLDKSAAPTLKPVTLEDFAQPSLLRPGNDGVIFTTGGIVAEALKAADSLEGKGISMSVVNVRVLKPIQASSLAGFVRPGMLVATLEENVVEGGLGGLVAESLMESGTQLSKFIRFGLHNQYSSVVGSQDYLRRHYELDGKSVARAIDATRGMPKSP